MKRILFHFLWIFLLVTARIGPPSAYADQNAQIFLDSLKLYEARKYAQAAEAFEKLAAEGIHNGKLYYNIANSYLKDGRLGPAVLWYERALRMMPGDPDVRFNLEYARTLLKDEPASFGSPVLQVLFFWKNLLGVSGWQWLGMVAGAVFWCLWAVIYFFKKPALKPVIYGFLGLTLLSAGTALYLQHAPVIHPRAVILNSAVSVRSGFSEDTTELFVLHEGTLVAVEKQTNDFLKIRYAEDKIGWVSKKMAEII